MRKPKEAVVGIVLIALAGLAGIVIPSKTFHVQEQKLLRNIKTIPFEMLDTEDTSQKLVVKESDYGKIIRTVNAGGTTYYHEPMQGQLNMSSAVEYSIQAVNKILGRKELSINNFINIKAMLQTKVEKYEAKPQYSYWNIQMSNESEKIHIWMNSVSGTILKMDVDLYEDSDMSSVALEELLEKYLSFSQFRMDNTEEETANDYKTSYERYARGKYFDCFAYKLQCTSPEQPDREYVKVILGLEEKV